MANKKETTPKLRVLPCSDERGSDRYAGIPDTQRPPGTSWRNNLTALSQKHNLIFTAYGEYVEISAPTFPEQKVPMRPSVRLNCVPYAASGKRGYIEPARPCAANHIIVGELGDDEVLLIACDNGCVIGLWTDHLADIFGQREWFGQRMPPMKPFFVQDVGASAWGLAIHKTARMIAVSSNTHKILVFAFAIDSTDPIMTNGTNDDCRSGEFDVLMEFGGPFESFSEPTFLRSLGNGLDLSQDLLENPWTVDRREHDLVIGLVGHQDNIPNIAFWNPGSPSSNAMAGETSSRVYLASIDIAGNIFVWDVWAARSTHSLTCDDLGCSGERGWNVTCVDPTVACAAKNQKEIYGTDHVKTRVFSRILDNSACIASVKDNSRKHPAFARFLTVPVPSNQGFSEAIEQATEDHEGTEDALMSMAYQMMEVEGEVDEDNDVSLEGVDVGPAEEGELVFDEATSIDLDGEDVSNIYQDDAAHHFNEQTVFENTVDIVPATTMASRFTDSSRVDDRIHIVGYFPFNMVITSETDICLIQSTDPDANSTAPTTEMPLLALRCSEALHQKLPPSLMFPHLCHFERLNMIHQIPELGVVAVGNQIGRVALLTLTRPPPPSSKHHHRGKRQPPPFEEANADAEVDDKHHHHHHTGFKIEAILPFESQEKKLVRPEVPLLGMAVSPIRGSGGSLDDGTGTGGRYRLLMTYYDDTVLSYEIGRGAPEGELLVL